MTVPNVFTSGTKAKASEVNENFEYVGVVPIGSVLPWLKSYTNTPSLPDNFVECNGQTLSDADSVYNGQVIPDLNGDNRFLRGNSTSGGSGGSETKDVTHTHSIPERGVSTNPKLMGHNVASQYYEVTTASGGSATQDIMPPYYNVVWVMRIK